MHTKSTVSTRLFALAFSITILLFSFSQSKAYTVSNLTAEYHDGQIFLTWRNPIATNLQYNVYRSVVPITLSSQLNSTSYLGFVRDSSAKNIFWSKQSKAQLYYKITSGGQPLNGSQGLYVATCTGSLPYYYMVTVTNLSNDKEDKTIDLGNITPLPIQDVVVQPVPVFQDSIINVDGEVKHLYVQFVNNQETALYPAMNSTGSYGFNFWFVKRGSANKYPLFVIYEGFGDKATESVSIKDDYDNCYIMGVFDWLPIPKDGGVGDNTFFTGYHQDFNIYSKTNPIPTSGTVKLYCQKQYWEAISWLESQVPIDTTRLYLKGSSHDGFGALLAASLKPEKVAAVYCTIEPTTIAPSDDKTEQMWGKTSSKLQTDWPKWNSTTDTLAFSDIKNQASMLSTNILRNLPPIYDVHGKQDVTVMWNSGRITWMDSLQNNHVGGAWYWDQRDHGGDGKNYKDDETQPNYYRFATNISFPAFSNCSINQDPGGGNKNSGDPIGSINGYLDWHDDNIVDKPCKYAIHVFVKDFYVGGVLQIQYPSCTADVAIRRTQNFHPETGATIRWTNFDDVTGAKIQTGYLTYDGGVLFLPGLTINRTGNKIKFLIQNCELRVEDEDDRNTAINDPVDFLKSPDGYTANIDVAQNENAQVIVYDLMGRMVWEKNAALSIGTNTVEIPTPATGIFLVQVKGETFSQTEKLFF